MFLTGTNIIFRLRCSCAERCRIGWVVLLALFHEGSDCLRCDQFHLVSKTGQDPCPVMRCTARLHGDDAPLLLLEERDQFTPSQLAPDLHLSGLIHAVHLEDGLGGVRPIMVMLIAGGSFSTGSHDPYCGTLMPLGPSTPSVGVSWGCFVWKVVCTCITASDG